MNHVRSDYHIKLLENIYIFYLPLSIKAAVSCYLDAIKMLADISQEDPSPMGCNVS